MINLLNILFLFIHFFLDVFQTSDNVNLDGYTSSLIYATTYAYHIFYIYYQPR